MGSVTSTPPGLDCHIPPDETGISCSAPFPTNSEVTLHAQPSADTYYFAGWGPGPCASTGTTPDCTLRMDSNQTVSADFGIVALEVNMPSCAVGDCGSLRVTDSTGHDSTEAFDSCSGNCYWREFIVPAGTVVTLTVTTGPQGIFDGWGGDCAGTTGNVCVLTVTRFSTADVMVTEIFPDD